MPLTSGSRVGPYEVIGLLGAGGMGEVFRARDTRLDRDVAIKVLPESLAGNADRLRRFEQEARAAGSLNHPNVLAVYDVGSQDEIVYLVSELLEGQTLRDRIAAGPLTRAGSASSSPRRSRRAWPPRTTRASCTAISSPTTCS